jgi:hypothetical protein
MFATHQYILEGKALPCPYHVLHCFFKLILQINLRVSLSLRPHVIHHLLSTFGELVSVKPRP